MFSLASSRSSLNHPTAAAITTTRSHLLQQPGREPASLTAGRDGERAGSRLPSPPPLLPAPPRLPALLRRLSQPAGPPRAGRFSSGRGSRARPPRPVPAPRPGVRGVAALRGPSSGSGARAGQRGQLRCLYTVNWYFNFIFFFSEEFLVVVGSLVGGREVSSLRYLNGHYIYSRLSAAEPFPACLVG